jgi:hypothetical protein
VVVVEPCGAAIAVASAATTTAGTAQTPTIASGGMAPGKDHLKTTITIYNFTR